jgi:hypothetical protein
VKRSPFNVRRSTFSGMSASLCLLEAKETGDFAFDGERQTVNGERRTSNASPLQREIAHIPMKLQTLNGAAAFLQTFGDRLITIHQLERVQ